MNDFQDDELQALARALVKAPPEASLPALEWTAEAAGLLDVAYATEESPVGRLLLAATPRGLVRIAYLDADDESAVLQELSDRLTPRVLRSPHRLDEARRELERYFAGSQRDFASALDWRLTSGFARRVLRATVAIPYGSASTYKQVAARAGSPRGHRAAGNALGSNPLPIVVPCHRVLQTGGGLGGYTGGLQRKRTLLAIEGHRSDC